MNLIKRIYRDGHYSFLKEWSEAHGKEAPPEDMLPVRHGVVIQDEDYGPLLAMAFVYKDEDAPTGWLGFLTTAPNLGPKKAYRACLAALEAAEELARKLGIRYIYINAASLGYGRLLKRIGWACNHEVNMEFCRYLEPVAIKKGGE